MPKQVAVAVSGDDGVFHINRTSGLITLQALPIFLKREIFNIKVRVSYSNTLINAHMQSVITSNPRHDQASEVSPQGRLMDYSITTLVIRVVDLNNNPPTFYGEKGQQSMFELTMYEHPPEGEILRGLKITVNDSDQVR